MGEQEPKVSDDDALNAIDVIGLGDAHLLQRVLRIYVSQHASLERDLAEAREMEEAAEREADHKHQLLMEACDQRDAALRDLAELREAARKLCETATAPAGRIMSTQEHHERLWRWQSTMLAAAKDLAALLPAEPPKAPVEDRAWLAAGNDALQRDGDEWRRVKLRRVNSGGYWEVCRYDDWSISHARASDLKEPPKEASDGK